MTPRNPCLDCKWRDADKNRKECLNCDRRIAYLRALDGDSLTGLPSVVIDGPSLEEAKLYQPQSAPPPDMGPAVRDIIIDACWDHGVQMSEVINGRVGGLVPSGVVAARREVVTRLLEDGVRVEQIIDATGLSRSTIYHHAAMAGIQMSSPPAPMAEAVAARLAEICAANGIPRELLTLTTAHSQRVKAARCQAVSSLRNPPFAMSLEKIAEALGLGRSTVKRYAAMSDVRPPVPPPRRPDAVVAEVCRQEGISPKDISAPAAKRVRILVTARLRGEPYRLSLLEVGKLIGMGHKAVCDYTNIAKGWGLLPAGQCYAARRASRARKEA